jgi:L-alanine-DL-glutamate epimerase-like enolase superfamily enzyme
MNRRHFLGLSTGLLVGAALPGDADVRAGALKDFRITRVTGFRHVCPRPKFIGKNAFLGDHGRETAEDVLRIATNQGVEGIGIGTATPELARKLIGHRLDEYWKPRLGVVSPLGRADHALFDLIGKALHVPAWKLIGGQGPEWVPVYDGSFYFSDLMPEYKDRGVARLLEEIEASLQAGHRAFKIKVGRGHKWMEEKAGFRRDVEVVQAIRRRIGKEATLMVDANNGFGLETTKRWLDAVGDDLFWIEEPFPEVVEQDLELKAFLRQKGWKTRIADGESAHEVRHFDPFLEPEAIDVLQPDIRHFGLTLQWELARKMASRPALKLAPHNWGSFLGLYMMLVLARGIPNFLLAEQDPSTSDLFDVSGFEFKDGKMRVPDTPGCGLRLREDVFREKYAKGAWVVGS